MTAATGLRGPAFVGRLRDHGDAPAVLTVDEQLTYRQLADRVEEVVMQIGGGRRLVLVETANDIGSLVGYLAALHGGHVALLAARDDRAQVAELTERFDPDVIIGPSAVRSRRDGSRHQLHPELALLMTTSGSTGTPRLVRLSGAALDANASAIATTLDMTPFDRAAVTLPIHYCYGLSVINSNLLCGAAVLLSGASVLDPAFWTAFREHRATSLHGVPHTFALLDRVGFADMSLPHLRCVTQAGGRLAPADVRRWAETGTRQGWRLTVMYGQTEATARMAYLPPALAATHPDAVGVAVPGGSFTVERVDEQGVGELVYEGPNVMLGYADDPADLAIGRVVHALHTGDLGRLRPDGLLEIVGRRSRFVKPFGIRTDLDGLEHLLAEHGIEAAATGTDATVVIAARRTPSEDDATLRERARAVVTGRTGLPGGVVTVSPVAELPRRPNGKLDHPAVAALANPEVTPGRWAGLRSRLRRHPPGTVQEVFARTFPGEKLSDDVSFVDLGGDSLTYVQVSADIERVLGGLPPGWDHLPLQRLEAVALPPAPTRRATVETGVLLRALAILLVVGEHAHLWGIIGGAHLLFALSGWMFARFVLTADRQPDRAPGSGGRRVRGLSRRIIAGAARIAVPSAVWIAFRALLHNVRFVDILLVGSLIPPLVPGYWFVDSLVQILLLLAAMFALPKLRHLEQRHPFGFAATVLTLALVGRLYPTAYGWWFTTDIYSPQVVLWLFVLGWMAQRAQSGTQRWATIAAILVLVPTFFGADVMRTAIVVVGLLLLHFVPTVRVPRPVAAAATTLAAASLAIYLTHFGILPLSNLGVPPEVVAPLGIATGIATWWVVTTVVRRVAERRAHRTVSVTVPAPDRQLRRVPCPLPVEQHDAATGAQVGQVGAGQRGRDSGKRGRIGVGQVQRSELGLELGLEGQQ